MLRHPQIIRIDILGFELLSPLDDSHGLLQNVHPFGLQFELRLFLLADISLDQFNQENDDVHDLLVHYVDAPHRHFCVLFVRFYCQKVLNVLDVRLFV